MKICRPVLGRRQSTARHAPAPRIQQSRTLCVPAAGQDRRGHARGVSSRGRELAMMRIAMALTVVLLLSAPTGAQGPTAPGSPLALLVKPRVQKELKLDEEQAATVKKLHGTVSENTKAAGSAYRALAKALPPEQAHPLKKIRYQARGGVAIGDNDVAKALGLTAKQKEEVKAV